MLAISNINSFLLKEFLQPFFNPKCSPALVLNEPLRCRRNYTSASQPNLESGLHDGWMQQIIFVSFVSVASASSRTSPESEGFRVGHDRSDALGCCLIVVLVVAIFQHP
jgi:hypothetical protein